MIGYRHVDARFPFLWEDAAQPPGRWHGPGEGPVHTFADTPDGAWAELLRHEEITDPADVLTIRRALWAVELGEIDLAHPRLPRRILTGGPVPAGTQVPESYLLDLEREAFGRLCRTPQTQARMLHLLQHGKPLRN
mgnify:CR=1 FL=1